MLEKRLLEAFRKLSYEDQLRKVRLIEALAKLPSELPQDRYNGCNYLRIKKIS